MGWTVRFEGHHRSPWRSGEPERVCANLMVHVTASHYLAPRYDNSGHKMPFPTWHSNQTNIERTDNVIKQIASMFASQSDVVPIIAPLNE